LVKNGSVGRLFLESEDVIAEKVFEPVHLRSVELRKIAGQIPGHSVTNSVKDRHIEDRRQENM
jgi:hypothetical protein